VKTRLALPLLLTSASIMVSGICLPSRDAARAQDSSPVLRRPRARAPDEGARAPAAHGTTTPPLRTDLEERGHAPATAPVDVSFNLEDAELPDLVRLVARITGKRFILPARARRTKVTIDAPSDVTGDEAYEALLAILAQEGMRLEPWDGYLRLVGPDHCVHPPLRPIPDDERIVTRMARLGDVAVEDVAPLLGDLGSGAGIISAYPPTNLLILVDSRTSVQRMLRFIEEIDIPTDRSSGSTAED
jgi:general secretion pathway protein D